MYYTIYIYIFFTIIYYIVYIPYYTIILYYISVILYSYVYLYNVASIPSSEPCLFCRGWNWTSHGCPGGDVCKSLVSSMAKAGFQRLSLTSQRKTRIKHPSSTQRKTVRHCRFEVEDGFHANPIVWTSRNHNCVHSHKFFSALRGQDVLPAAAFWNLLGLWEIALEHIRSVD